MESNLNSNYIDRIDTFEKGQMNSEELQNFQEDLRTNAQLAEHYHYIKDLKTALQKERTGKLINQFKDWDLSSAIQTHPQNNASKIIKLNPGRRWMAIAASLLFLAFAGWWTLSTNQESNHLALFDQNFTPYPSTTTVRSNSQEKALLLYTAEKYESAKDLLLKSNDPDAKFYLANTYLALGESQAAISALQEYNGEKFRSAVVWYLALSYLQAEQMDNATTLLKQAIADQGAYSKRAAEVLQALAK